MMLESKLAPLLSYRSIISGYFFQKSGRQQVKWEIHCVERCDILDLPPSCQIYTNFNRDWNVTSMSDRSPISLNSESFYFLNDCISKSYQKIRKMLQASSRLISVWFCVKYEKIRNMFQESSRSFSQWFLYESLFKK